NDQAIEQLEEDLVQHLALVPQRGPHQEGRSAADVLRAIRGRDRTGDEMAPATAWWRTAPAPVAARGARSPTGRLPFHQREPAPQRRSAADGGRASGGGAGVGEEEADARDGG